MQISIGQFSRMTRLSVKALRLYDKSGLLIPDFVDPSSGYRYYKVEQAQQAEIIRILRSVDMSLDDIRVVLNLTEGDHVVQQLRIHKDRLNEQLEEQQRKLAYLETLINDRQKLAPREVSIVTVEDQLILSAKKTTSLARIQQDVASAFQSLGRAIEEKTLSTCGVPLIIYHHFIDKESEGEIEVCVPLSDAYVGGPELSGRKLQGGTMAMIEHHGPYEGLASTYQVITTWIAQNGYYFAGSPREYYLNDPHKVPARELVTRIEFPVSVQPCENGDFPAPSDT